MSQRAPTTEPGYVNQHCLITVACSNPPRIDPQYEATQYVYILHCPECGENCGTAGCSIWIRKCPTCNENDPNVEEGPPLLNDERTWRL